MEHVRPFRREDSHAVAEMHAKSYFRSKEHASPGLAEYYEKTFFDNPWYDEKFSSLVYCNKNGVPAGFMGRLVRPMIFDGKKITVAIAHRLLADTEYASPYAAPMLVRNFLSGEQDMTIADGANDKAIRIWKAAGGGVSLIYSMKWFAPLRPFGFAISMLGNKKRISPAFIRTVLPFAKIFDYTFGKVVGWDFRKAPADTLITDAGIDSLMDCVDQFTSSHRLKPDYDRRSFEWVYNVLRNNTYRGRFKGHIVKSLTGQKIGAFLYYLNSSRHCEVVFLAAYPGCRQQVLTYLLHCAYSQGAVGVIGRMEPDFLEVFWQNNLFVKRGCWALVHSADESLLDVINRGQAYISSLEGELWLHSPDDRL